MHCLRASRSGAWNKFQMRKSAICGILSLTIKPRSCIIGVHSNHCVREQLQECDIWISERPRTENVDEVIEAYALGLAPIPDEEADLLRSVMTSPNININ
jgi:hypothetical protein